jgi:hypothetical protein
VLELLSNLSKKLEILLIRKNDEFIPIDIFDEISTKINEKFNALDEGYGNPEGTDYYFKCEDNGMEFLITINKRTFKDKVLLFAAIHGISEMDDTLFYTMKILLKDTLLPIAQKVYWIFDEQIHRHTQELYQLTSMAENSFRVLIVHFMTFKYGLEWWEQVAKGIKGSKEKRLEGYQRALTDLKDISLDMYSLDIKDLTRLVESEYTFDVNFKVEIKTHQELPADEKLVEAELRKLVKKLIDDPLNYKLKTEKGFWKHELSAFFEDPDEFKKKWDRLSDDRNHIAHNKIIDLNMYYVMKKNSEYVIGELEKALIKLGRSEISLEEKEYNETMYQLLLEDTKSRDIEASGTKIYNQRQIEEEFIEYLTNNILSPADDMLYFCEALRSYFVDEISDISSPHTLIDVTGFNDESFVFSIIDCHLSDDEGDQSYLKLKLKTDSGSEEYVITFTNTTVELNEDNIYEVVTEAELDAYDLEKDVDREFGFDNIIISCLEGFINEQPSNHALHKMYND